MKNQILSDSTVVYYAVKVNGKIVTTKFSNSNTAEQAKLQLPEDQCMIAEIVTVTVDGKELLLG